MRSINDGPEQKRNPARYRGALQYAREDHPVLGVPGVQPPCSPAATKIGGLRMQSAGGQSHGLAGLLQSQGTLPSSDSVQRAREILQRLRGLARENLVTAGRDDFAGMPNSLGGRSASAGGWARIARRFDAAETFLFKNCYDFLRRKRWQLRHEPPRSACTR